MILGFLAFLAVISIHAPARGATTPRRSARPVTTHFNPRSREGSDEPVLETTDIIPEFQSTLPRGERQASTRVNVIQQNFNPRSREGSDPRMLNSYLLWQDFNPRSREGSDLLSYLPLLHQNISIHAPARGATFDSMRCISVHGISIHAPARGATITAFPRFATFYISIHAPARGATCRRSRHFPFRPISIHAPARGATQYPRYYHALQLISIHAPARGATIRRCTCFLKVRNFNPRSREGSDFNFI